jgi:hypothetical protein
LALHFLVVIRNVRVDLGLVIQVKRNDLVHQRQRKCWEVCRDHFWRMALVVKPKHVVKADSVAGNVNETAVVGG